MADTGTAVRAEAVPDLVCTLVHLIAPQRVDKVEPELRLIGDLGFHSLALAELGFTVEDLFDIEALTPEIAMSLEKVEDIIRMITGHVLDGSAKLPDDFEVNAICARYGAVWPLEK